MCVAKTPQSVTIHTTGLSAKEVSKVFAACKLGFNAKFVLSPETVVYGTTPDETSGKLVPSWIGWEGKEVVVPQGTNPREFFSQDVAS